MSPDPCPHCCETSGVARLASTSSAVQAWSCASCGTNWAVTIVNPRLYLDRLAAAVQLAATRSLRAEVITLADQVGRITDSALRTPRWPYAQVKSEIRSRPIPRRPRVESRDQSAAQ